MKDPENKQRISIYIDRDLVKKADNLLSLAGCKSRNEFVTKAIERYIGELALGGDISFVTEALSASISKACNESFAKVSGALFRYAVYVDMMVRILAECVDLTPGELEEFQRQAYKMNSSLASSISSTNGTPRPQAIKSEPPFKAKPSEANALPQTHRTDTLRIPMTADTSYPIPTPRTSSFVSSENF